MNFKTYLKREIEKALFIEINMDVTLKLKGNPILKRGDYPLLPDDIIDYAKKGIDSIPSDSLIRGMIYVIACDRDFKYNASYIDFLNSIEGIQSYLIMNIEKYKVSDTKKAIVYSTALSVLNPKAENKMNTIYLLMDYYEKTNLEFIEDEIIEKLNSLTNEYPAYGIPNLHLGEYYLDKDIDKAKMHLRKCQNDSKTKEKAFEILEKIRIVEEYDKAVDLVKNEKGDEALKTLIPYCNENPENLDAKYYTAIAYRQIGDSYNALYYLKELTDIAERPEVYNEIGFNLAKMEEFQAAMEYFKKALKITPDDSSIICNIGVCHLNLLEVEEAKKAFELASRINPKDEVAKSWIKEMGKGI